MSLHKIKAAVDAAEGNARRMGEVVLMIAQADEHAAEVMAADLDNPEMSLQKCFDALYEYAKKHQKNGFWGCVCNRFDPENPVIQFAADFYKVDLGAAASETPETQPLGRGSDDLDLMSLL
ncbi:hypothetical protein [Butyricicoccus sp. AF18-9LB]|uniref:hypothetical protein n=1 Tax=Butyricicoccus sp. AF18-9LB TaxID=3002521 RepID=UPI0022E7037B|nr:hypothetical protein [Butyricicoccus sp. AF18-9LB]